MMKSAHRYVYLQSVLPVDQASDSDVNNVNSSYSDTSLPTGQQLFTISSELAAQPSQSSEGDGSDGCVFVGYVKPRHERTPEIVTLSSDPEVEEGEVMVSPVAKHAYTDFMILFYFSK
jgi:hypothetical protein